MDNQLYLTKLYDLYGDLLTELQKKYFEDYYFNDLSLFEISDNYSVTRNAIYNSLKDSEEKLKNYELKLNFYKKLEQLKSIPEIDDNLKKKIINILE